MLHFLTLNKQTNLKTSHKNEKKKFRKQDPRGNAKDCRRVLRKDQTKRQDVELYVRKRQR